MRKGSKHTAETRAKLSLAAKGRSTTSETRAKMAVRMQGNQYALGYRHTQETRDKISAAMTGKQNTLGHALSQEHRAKISAAGRGKKRTPETRARMSAAQAGRIFTPEHRAKISASRMGQKPTPEQLAKISAALRGANNPRWRGGRSCEPYTHEFNRELKESVRARCDYRCQVCGKPQAGCSRALDVHHVDYDKLNVNPTNLVALCHSCHGRTSVNRETWTARFLGRIRMAQEQAVA